MSAQLRDGGLGYTRPSEDEAAHSGFPTHGATRDGGSSSEEGQEEQETAHQGERQNSPEVVVEGQQPGGTYRGTER